MEDIMKGIIQSCFIILFLFCVPASFSDSFTFIEWLYISIWNFAISACSRGNLEHASASFTISMEGFQKWNVFDASDLAIMEANSAQALGKSS